ncbi:MAG: hypothetical protein ACXACC_02015 [Promethearchaeota archaeon]|jgi:hypothetical protein
MVDIITTILGIFISIIASFCFNFGIVLQKKGLKEGSEIKIEEGVRNLYNTFKEFSKNKSWLSGTLLGLIGMIPYAIAMGLVGIVVVQPLMSIGLLFFVISAVKMLNEKITYYEIIAIGILIVSPILIALTGITNIFIDLYQFVIPFIIFLSPLFVLGIGFYFLSKQKRGTQFEGMFLMFIGAILYSIGAIFTNILAQAFTEANIFPLFFWEILFGIFWFDYLHLWMFISSWGMLVFYISSVIFLQSALQKSKALTIVPIQNAIMLIIPIIAGLFVFNQTFQNLILFLVALVLILISTISLSRFQVKIELIQTDG